MKNRGFTLVELLIVIAILAVLSVTVVVVLNPAELLRQARDSRRLSDLNAIHRAVSLFLTDQSAATWAASYNCTATGTPPMGATGCTLSSSTAVNGTGWVDVDLTAVTSGSPLSTLPLDPANGAGQFYAFKKTPSMTWELDAALESTKYSALESTDGGDNASWYEIGNDANLNL
jgi:prepilin-type N-terminal cleavage/methylation domain-containing protein